MIYNNALPDNSPTKLAITCPASRIKPEILAPALAILHKAGFETLLDETCNSTSANYFSASDKIRLKNLQHFLDNPQVEAILMGRGGYGITRIIRQLDWQKFKAKPKWIIGFSDITLLHLSLYKFTQLPSIHGGMLEYLQDQQSAATLFSLLMGESYNYQFAPNYYNRLGQAEGILLGGNLTLLAHSIGGVCLPNLENAILFLEDTNESLHNIDRMLWQLAHAGIFAKLRGLVCGYFTNLRDNSPSFGQNVYEIIYAHCHSYDFPIAFNFPAGHQKPNLALKLGAVHKLQVSKAQSILSCK